MFRKLFTSTVLVAAAWSAASPAFAQAGGGFTYQGRIKEGGFPLDGFVNLAFELFSAPTGGNPIASQQFNGLTVVDGLFSVTLNANGQFGPNAFDGSPRYLQLVVNGNKVGPRQPINSVPYAAVAAKALSLEGFTPTDGHSLDAADGFPQDVVLVQNDGTVLLGTAFSLQASIDQLSPAISQKTSAANLYQYFTVGQTGYMTQLDIYLTGSPNGDEEMHVVLDGPGGGVSGLAQIYRLVPKGFTGWFSVPIDTPFPVTAGAQLSFWMGVAPSVAVHWGPNNPYPGGTSPPLSAQNGDLAFRSYVGQPEVSGSALTVTPDGSVGIGTSDPYWIFGVDPQGPGGVVIGGQDVHFGGRTSLMLSVTGESDGFSAIQSIRSAGSLYGDLALNAAGGNVGIGTTTPQATLDVDGGIRAQLVRTSVLEIVGGSDIAEPFDVHGDAVEPGMIVCIDRTRVGQLRVADRPYDTSVAGIVSGANGIQVGLTLSQAGTVADGKHPVAMTGRVWAWCDADANGPIMAGDLLTTSATPGHAMKALDASRAGGAVIGKAMSSLESGRGLVLVLVNLQ